MPFGAYVIVTMKRSVKEQDNRKMVEMRESYCTRMILLGTSVSGHKKIQATPRNNLTEKGSRIAHLQVWKPVDGLNDW